MIFDLDHLDRVGRYRLLASAIVPRPIAWVTTISSAGVVNAAPFSFFSGISTSPPLVSICVGDRRDGVPKDTLRNAGETGEMVVNLVSFDLREEMVACARDYPPEVSEVEELGLATAPSEAVAPPRLSASPLNLECRVERVIDFGGTSMIVGRVLRVHVRDDLLREGAVDARAFRPLGRLGGQEYLDPEKGLFEIPSP